MSSSSKTSESSKKTRTLSPMERHQLSDITSYFNEKLITGKCKITSKPHRWASKSNFLEDISSNSSYDILDLPLLYFGLCDISSINEIMIDKSNNISYSQKAAVNELFKIKYAEKQYPGEINEKVMRDISKTKLYQLKKKGEKRLVFYLVFFFFGSWWTGIHFLSTRIVIFA